LVEAPDDVGWIEIGRRADFHSNAHWFVAPFSAVSPDECHFDRHGISFNGLEVQADLLE
jgi:hypothetical protein